MHGPPWLESVTVPGALIVIGFALLFLSMKMNGRHDPSKNGYNVELKLFGHKIIQTSHRWIVFTTFMALVALGSHYLAEYSLHIYDVTPVDKITHGLSGMAATAFILNFNLTKGRRIYYPTAIGLTWIGFIGWEVYEWFAVMFDPNTTIETGWWDLVIDLWVDTLGALSICFVYDEFKKESQKKGARS